LLLLLLLLLQARALPQQQPATTAATLPLQQQPTSSMHAPKAMTSNPWQPQHGSSMAAAAAAEWCLLQLVWLLVLAVHCCWWRCWD
jgi:hypothetical protein